MTGTHVCKTCGSLNRTLRIEPLSRLCYYYCPIAGRIYVYEVEGGFRCDNWRKIE